MSLEHWLRRKILEEFGLKVADSPALSEAVRSVGRRRGVPDDELVRIAASDAAVRLEIAAAMTVGESHFLRHAEHEEAIRGQVESVISRGRRARIWSAGCARGEEPFSVAMSLLERFGRGARTVVEIEATDVDEGSIACGRGGVFGAWSLRGMGPELQARYFERSTAGFRISEELRSWVRFSRRSVQSQILDFPTASVDLILFRNVGIYLTAEALATIHDGFARVLGPGGLLLQAATDPAPVEGHVLRRWAEGPYGSYRVQAELREPQRAAASRKRPAFGSTLGERSGRWPRVAAISGEVTRAAPDEQASEKAAVSISRASALADAGRVQEALALVNQLIEKHPRQRGAYVLRAQLQLHQHDGEGAVEDLRRALFLDPSDSLARYWYSVALKESGRMRDAEAQRRVLASHLAGRRGSDRLSDGETTVDDLRSLIPDEAKELA